MDRGRVLGTRIFVCEYVTGGGFSATALPVGLRREGDVMLRGLLGHLARLEGLDIVISRDARLAAADLPAQVVPIAAAQDPWPVWAGMIAAADMVWPIAPETNGLLERLSAMVLAAHRRLIGSTPAAVRLCASKFATAAHLSAHAIPAVPTRRLMDWQAGMIPSASGRLVIKPDDGAGAEDCFLIAPPDTPADFLRNQASPARFVVQPYVTGAAASLCLLCREGEARMLSCNQQLVALAHGQFRCHGWIVGGMERYRARYEPIAQGIAAAIPGLAGYVGVDLVDGADGPLVLEVNPRLTTSYAGLAASLKANPAAWVLSVCQGETWPGIPLPRLPYHLHV